MCKQRNIFKWNKVKIMPIDDVLAPCFQVISSECIEYKKKKFLAKAWNACNILIFRNDVRFKYILTTILHITG